MRRLQVNNYSEIVRLIGSDPVVVRLHDHALRNGFTRDAPEHGIESLLRLMQAAGIATVGEVLSLVEKHEKPLILLISEMGGQHAGVNATAKAPLCAPSLACLLAIVFHRPELIDQGVLASIGWNEDDVAQLIAGLEKALLGREHASSVQMRAGPSA